MKRYHLAVLKKAYIRQVVAGEKTVELRLMRSRRVPFGRISAGDEIFIKQSCGPVTARAIVKRVLEFENLTPAKVRQLHSKYNKYVRGADEYWTERADCRYACLIWLADVEQIEKQNINKTDQRAWVVLSYAESFGLL